MNEIVVLVPVLARPRNAAVVADSFRAARTVPSRLLFICSPGDRDEIAACERTGEPLIVLPTPPGPGDFARKINHAFGLTAEPYVFQAADDVTFEPGWDTAVLMAAAKTGAGVVGTNDLGNRAVMNGHHSTHSLIRRSYVDEHGASLDGPGVVFHEGYGHQWVDTELVELAKSRGQWAFARDAIVRHHHPFWDRTVVRDATYRKGLATGAADQRLYRTRSRQWARGAA